MPKIEKICLICKKQFEVIPSKKGTKYCSIKCYGDSIKGNQINKGKKRTEAFKENLRRIRKGKKWDEMTKKKMSKNNYWKGKKLPEIIRKKMSKTRLQKGYKGENHYNWKGGITPENNKIRNSLEYKLWRNAVYKRDNFICQKYKTRGGELEAHHINNFTDFSKLRFAIDNGITLSKKAHEEFHKKYGIKNNTKEQLDEFLQHSNVL